LHAFTSTFNSDTKLDFDDFTKEVVGDLVIQKVNFSRATFKEAHEFKKRLNNDILSNNLKIIIDLSSCEFIDSAFLGSLVVVHKKMTECSGEIKYVIPRQSAFYLFKLIGLYEVLKLYARKEDAIESFGKLYSKTIA
jgi:anti-anti-sigma regulatory factor